MDKFHQYALTIEWTGNTGKGTAGYRLYDRAHTVTGQYKPVLDCSADPSFLGDKTKYSPEDLLVASLSSCHMLWYLHLCSDAGVVVTAYQDEAKAEMVETKEKGGYFKTVDLYPVVTVADPVMVEKAMALHAQAGQHCFIANSVNFPVQYHPCVKTK